MNFGVVDLNDEDIEFWKDVRQFMDAHVADEVIAHERTHGDGFNEGLHMALGERRWVLPDWPVERGGAGLSPIRTHLIERELADRHAPNILRSTTRLTLSTIDRFGDREMADEVLAGVASGHTRICLGYTEPDAGSDLAAITTRATRDGDDWTIDGRKMFTTGAQHAQYCFLLTRTNPEALGHQGMTVFLVPLNSDGIEITGIDTLGGERTNFVYYDGVRVSDRYRLGDVDAGWSVVRGALDDEHGIGRTAQRLAGAGGVSYERYTRFALAAAERWAIDSADEQGRRPIDDPVVRSRLARVAYHVELSAATPAPLSRLVSSETLIADAAALVDLVGPAALLQQDDDDAIEDGIFEYTHRFAQGTAIYGGTTDVFRNIVAQRFLQLPRSARRA
jgi:alkylation response protein AidB-like acyl-CoA dehydrogenase